MILCLTIVTSFVDRQFSAQSLQLQSSEQRYRQLVESAQVVLWRGGVGSTEFSYVKSTGGEYSATPTESWLRVPAFWIDHLHPEDRSLVESRCAAAVETPGPQRFEHRMITADGRTIWLRTSVLLLKGERINEFVGVMTDITERKKSAGRGRRGQPRHGWVPGGDRAVESWADTGKLADERRTGDHEAAAADDAAP